MKSAVELAYETLDAIAAIAGGEAIAGVVMMPIAGLRELLAEISTVTTAHADLQARFAAAHGRLVALADDEIDDDWPVARVQRSAFEQCARIVGELRGVTS